MDPGLPAVGRPAPHGVPLPAALPARDARVQRAAGAARGRPGPPRALLAFGGARAGEERMSELLRAEDLTVTFPLRRGRRKLKVNALRGVTITLERGETLGLVGESGSGKSTFARA